MSADHRRLFDALVRVFGADHAITAAHLLPGVADALDGVLHPTWRVHTDGTVVLQPSETEITDLLEHSILTHGVGETMRLLARLDWRAARALDRMSALSPRHGIGLP